MEPSGLLSWCLSSSITEDPLTIQTATWPDDLDFKFVLFYCLQARAEGIHWFSSLDVTVLMGGSHALKGLLLRVGTVALIPALVQSPGSFWELGSLSHQLILETGPSALHVPFWESSESTKLTVCCCHPVSCFCSLPPKDPRKSHDPVLGVDFTFPLVFSKWWDLSCHSFTEMKKSSWTETAGLTLNSLAVLLWASCGFTQLFPLVPNCRHTPALC